MSTIETTSASVPTVPPAKRGKGRRPVRESRRRELLDAVTAWKMTPLAKREPSTLTELAAKHGVNKQLAHYYYKQAPGSLEEFIDQCEREVLQRYPCVLDALTKQAEKGNVEAAKAYMRGLVEPRRPEPKPPSTIGNIHLQQTIQMLLHPESTPGSVQNGPAESSNRPILSN